MTKTKIKPQDDQAAKLRSVLEYYAGTPSKKWPLPIKKSSRTGKTKIGRRSQAEWAEMFGITRSYLSKVLNNEDGFMLKQPRRFATFVAGQLSQAFGIDIKPEDCWDLDD